MPFKQELPSTEDVTSSDPGYAYITLNTTKHHSESDQIAKR